MAATERILITGGTVIPYGAGADVITGGDVVLEGGLVASVGPASGHSPGAGTVIDATGKLVMPGMINAHTHLYSALARAMTAEIAPSASFTEILEHLWWRLDRALTDEDNRLSAAVGALDLVRNGTTTIIDHHASQTRIEGSLDLVAGALADVGLRANLCFEVSDRGGREEGLRGLAENDRFAAVVAGRDDSTLGASVGLHASFTLDDETLDRAAGIAEARGIGCHVHVAEDVADVADSLKRSGVRVVRRLHGHGILGPMSVAAHCNHIDADEMGLLRDTETLVAHNPQSNMNNAVGTSDVPRLLDEGVRVGLGTDGFTASMFDEMKVANLLHRHNAGDPRVGHDTAIRLGFAGNSEAATRLFGTTLGRLEPGAAADVIVLDYDPPTPILNGNFGGHVIFGLTGWMVETVIVGGRVVVRDREVLTVDAAKIEARAREAAVALWKRM